MASKVAKDIHPALKESITAIWRVMQAVFLFSVFINILMLAVPMYMLQLFDRVVATQSSDTLMVLSVMVVAAILAMSALEAVRGRLMMVLGNWFDRKLAGYLLGGSISSANEKGDGSAQPLRDLGNVKNFLAGPGLFPVLDAAWIPVFLGIVYYMHAFLGIISILGGCVLFGLAIANDVFTKRATQIASFAANKNLNDADAAVRNADVIQALGMKNAIIGKWSNANSEASSLLAVSSRRSGLISAIAKFVRLLVQVSILGTGAYLAMVQEISPGTMIAASIIMGRGLAPIEQSIQGWRGIVSARAAFARLRETMQMADREETVTPLPRPNGQLTVEQVTYVPPGAESPTLKRVSFSVAPGEIIGLIGPTAAGKTTLSRLLVGSLKQSLGSIQIDGIEVSSWHSEDRGKYIGYLPQDIELFDGTVRENISRFQEAEDDEVFAAAKLAGVYRMILSLPMAFDTEIGPSGMRLSGGQRQRLALARALFRNPVIVVLDEPNSNLDRAGESELLSAVSRVKDAGATVILVVQHATVLQGVDKLLVLKDGEVAQFGAREEVLAKMGYTSAKPDEASPEPSPKKPKAVKKARKVKKQ